MNYFLRTFRRWPRARDPATALAAEAASFGLAAAAGGDKYAILKCGAGLADVGCPATSGPEVGATTRSAFAAAVVGAARANGRSADEYGETFPGNDRKVRGQATTAPDLAARSVQASARSNRINCNKLHTSRNLECLLFADVTKCTMA